MIIYYSKNSVALILNKEFCITTNKIVRYDIYHQSLYHNSLNTIRIKDGFYSIKGNSQIK